ncbi:hypothetical protein JVU11DRAFT_11434 [Chiua virens]|nr:hypothetical protein JVU11DRAFT_11434 [Chiua virens]
MSRQAQLDAICSLLVALGLTAAEAAQVHSAVNVGPSESTSSVPGSSPSSLLLSMEDLHVEDPCPPVVVAPLLTPIQTTVTTVAPPDHAPSTAATDATTVHPTVAVEIGGALTTYSHLPTSSVTVSGEVRYQHTYRGFRFDIPRAGSVGPFYVVTCGKRVGAFSTWPHTSSFVMGVSRACYTRTSSLHAAITHMLDAINLGEAEYRP